MDDLISRQAAIDAIRGEIEINGYSHVVDVLEQLPSAQPERKKGKWISNSPVTMRCNQCTYVASDWIVHEFHYCPNCGARMDADGETGGQTMRSIDADKFLQDMADLYRKAGWDEREVHFSLADLRSNIGMEDTILIPQREPDTVPVIRCKDCKHYYALNEVRGNCSEYNFVEKIPIDFCSWAERKEE